MHFYSDTACVRDEPIVCYWCSLYISMTKGIERHQRMHRYPWITQACDVRSAIESFIARQIMFRSTIPSDNGAILRGLCSTPININFMSSTHFIFGSAMHYPETSIGYHRIQPSLHYVQISGNCSPLWLLHLIIREEGSWGLGFALEKSASCRTLPHTH